MRKKKTKKKKINRIVELITDGKVKKALELADVKDAEDLLAVGIQFGESGSHDVAEKIFSRVIELNPNDADAWSNKGVALRNLGRYDEAIKSYDKALKINPNDAMTWSNRGVALEKFGRYEEEIKCCEKALKINPSFAEAWYNKGVALGNLGRNEKAIQCYDKALKINPNLAQAWSNKGAELDDLGRHKEASKCYDKALKINPNDDKAWYNKGVTLWNLGRYEEAIQCYKQALKINPNDAGTWSNKGVALDNLGRYEEAIKCYDKALKINPDYYGGWLNKGVTLGNLGRDEEEIQCYDQSLKINPNYADAHGNKGITLLYLHKYEKSANELKKAKEIFSKSGAKKDADKAHRHEILAINATELMSRLNPLDKKFINCLSSKSLAELKDKSSEISKEVKNIVKEFAKKNIPEDARELLISKATCFSALSQALKFVKVDSKKLKKAENVFKKWQLEPLVKAVISLDTFIHFLRRYKSLNKIPKTDAEYLLRNILSPAYILDGDLTKEIFRGKPFPARTAGVSTEKEPKVISYSISQRKKDWVRFCLVQLNFSIKRQPPPKEFGYVLLEKDKVKDKIFKALKVAKENNVDIICFPELSFAKEWVEQLKDHHKEMLIIGGSYYEGAYNICPIIIDGRCIDPPYKKCQPSPFENPKTTGRGMKPGNILYVFETKFGRFSVLTCSDYKYRHSIYKEKVDFVISPSCEPNQSEAQERWGVDCKDYNVGVIFVNRAQQDDEFGGTCVIAKEHNIILNKLIDDGFKPQDNIEYKLFEINEESMIIMDLNLNAPPVDIPVDYAGRIRLSKEKCYKYKGNTWLPLTNS